MSEAMTNSEIEDVLSSIRRLVAQESRPAPERLVLTAEQRVAQANLSQPPAPVVVPGVVVAAVAARTPDADSEPGPDAAAAGFVPAEDASAEAAQTGPAPADITASEPEPEPAAAQAELEATLSALEAVLGPAPGASQAAEPAPEPEAAPADSEAQTDEAEADFALIDEDDLQRLVARLVREELRGQLGEKITLQVRKLVRAEIARALDERNLLS